MKAIHGSCRLSAARKILARSIVTLLKPALAVLAGAALTTLARANDTVTFSGGTLKDTLNTAGDGGNVLTDASGSNIDLSGTGLSDTVFSNVTAIDAIFSAANQTFAFDSTLFSFTPQVTISTGVGAATDAVDINGSNAITFTGANSYGGGTTINSGHVTFNNAAALGTGPVTMNDGTELRGSNTLTFNDTVNFIPGTNNATLSASGGNTVTFNILDTSNTAGLTFGSAGNTGTVVVGTVALAGTNLDTLTVAFGTLRNGGGLGNLTTGITTVTVNAGAILDVHDRSMEIADLEGAGNITLGTKLSTVLTVDIGNVGGVISGSGQLQVNGETFLTGANNYTGGTTVAANDFLQLGSGGTTGSIVGNVSFGASAALFFDRNNPYTFSGVISGAGSVVQQGTSILTLSGNSSYSGGTQIQSGDLVVTNSQALGTGPVTLSTGAELRGSGTVTLANLVNFVNPTTNATLSAAAGSTFTLNQLDISDTAAITFGSSGNTGAVVIGPNAANTATGNNVTVAFGTLRNGDGLSVLTDAGNTTTVNAGATLDLHDIPTGISSLAGSGNVTLGSLKGTVLTLDGGTFDGIISGAGALSINNLVIFTGANTYTGNTTVIANSDLQLGNGGTTGSVAGSVALRNNAGLIFDRSNAYSFAGLITGLGEVQQSGSGVLTLSGNNSYSIGTLINSGVLVAANSSALGSGPVTLSTGTELRGSGTVTLNNLVQFNSGTSNATISAAPGGTFTLNNLDVTNTNALTFGSTGNTGTVSLGSEVTLDPNSFSVTVAFGTLLNGAEVNQLLADSLIRTTVNSGATLAIANLNTTVNSLEGSGSITLGTKTATVLTLQGANFGGVISGAGSVNVASETIFTGANTYTGGTTIAANQFMQLGNGTPTGSIVGNVSLGNDAALEFDRSNAYIFTGVISGGGIVEQNGEGVLTLSGKNTYSGGTQINSGVLVVPNAGALGTGPVTLGNATELRGGIGAVTLNNTVTANSTTDATISAAPGGTLTLNHLDASHSGPLNFGSAGNTGKVVIGAFVIDGGGPITVAFGTLENGGGLGALTGPITVNAGATLAVNDTNTTIQNLAGSGSITLGTKTATVLTLRGAEFGGVISGAGSVNVAGGTTFTGANTYTGGTTIAANQFMQLGQGTATGSIAGSVSFAGNLAALFFHRSNAYNFSGAISGPGIVEQDGTGVLTLSGANSYTGGTQINSGVLVVPNAGALGTGPVTLSNGAELRASGKVTLNTSAVNFASGTGNATLSAAPGGTFTLNNLDTSNTFNLTFGSAGNTGTISLGSGVTVGNNIDSATVAFGTLLNGAEVSQLLANVVTIVNAGATLAIADLNTTVNSLEGSGSITLGTKTATVLTLQGAEFGGVISGAGSVNVASQTIFTGANTYTGGTTIAANQFMQLGQGTATGSIAGSVSFAGLATLEFDRSNAYNLGGAISGPGIVEQDGTGVLTLSGANSYTGGTQINSGVLVVPNAGALGTGPVTLGDGAEFRSSGTVKFTDPVTYSGTSSATISTSGILTLPNLTDSGSGLLIFGSSGNAGTVGLPSTGTLSASTSAQIEVAFGTLSNGGGLNTLTSNAIVTQVDLGATINLGDFNTTMNNLFGNGRVVLGTKPSTVLTLAGAFFSGAISGAGQVNATGGGSGIVEFTAANTYTGGTTVSAGRLAANNPSGSATGTGPVTIDNGASIGGSGTVSGAMTLDSGGTVKPGVNESGEPGTKFHGSSLLWEGGSTLDFQIGSTTDELLLTGALTKGTGTGFTINIENDTIVTGNYTLATFASTTFSLSDFTLDLPNSVSAILVENTKSLVLDITQAELPAHSEEPSAPTDSDLSNSAIADTTSGSSSSFTPSEPLQPTPEPGSALLLAFGGATLLGWRRKR